MKKYDIYCGFFWLLAALFVMGAALRFGLGSFRQPGPGFFPLLVGLLLAFLSLGIIMMARKEKKQDLAFQEWPGFSLNVPHMMVVLLAYPLVLERVGYLPTSFLLLLYLFRFCSHKKWWFSFFVATVVVALTYYFLVVVLQSQFPKGILDLG